MKIQLKEMYQGWAAVELGGFSSERLEKGTHEVTEALGEYLTKTFPDLAKVVEEPEEKAEEKAEKPKRRRGKKGAAA